MSLALRMTVVAVAVAVAGGAAGYWLARMQQGELPAAAATATAMVTTMAIVVIRMAALTSVPQSVF